MVGLSARDGGGAGLCDKVSAGLVASSKGENEYSSTKGSNNEPENHFCSLLSQS